MNSQGIVVRNLTWLQLENALYQHWFDLTANRSKFRPHFCSFIERQYPSKAVLNS